MASAPVPARARGSACRHDGGWDATLSTDIPPSRIARPQRSAQLFTIDRQLAQMSLQLRQDNRSEPQTSHVSPPGDGRWLASAEPGSVGRLGGSASVAMPRRYL